LRMMRVVKLFTFYKGAGSRCIGRIKSKKSHSLDLDATLLWIVTLCYHISMEVDMHILYHAFQSDSEFCIFNDDDDVEMFLPWVRRFQYLNKSYVTLFIVVRFD
jgi:hypothetical protein